LNGPVIFLPVCLAQIAPVARLMPLQPALNVSGRQSFEGVGGDDDAAGGK
jgi:hypothetical protein